MPSTLPLRFEQRAFYVMSSVTCECDAEWRVSGADSDRMHDSYTPNGSLTARMDSYRFVIYLKCIYGTLAISQTADGLDTLVGVSWRLRRVIRRKRARWSRFGRDPVPGPAVDRPNPAVSLDRRLSDFSSPRNNFQH
jgi:hypothetical protein